MKTHMRWMQCLARRFSSIAGTLPIILIACCLGGCGQRVTSTSLQDVADAYARGDYPRAYQGAVDAHQQAGSGEIRDQASYFAGISAFQLNRYPEAKRYLEPIATEATFENAGDASATLGLVRHAEQDYTNAVTDFQRASRLLTGDDHAHAAYHCAQSYQAMGQTAAARTQLVIARSKARDPDLRAKIEASLAESGYTLQVGAYNDLHNAEEKAQSVQAQSWASTLGPARIVRTISNRGGALYAVQVGVFHSHETARIEGERASGPVIIKAIAPHDQVVAVR